MSESDWKLLKVDKCSKRVCEEIMYAILNTGARLHSSHVFDHRSMLMMGSWTSADILVEIPRRMLVKSLVHNNNNCIGCPKGGAGYWNLIRKVFPDTYERMAELEERLGAKLIKLASGRVSLRDLDPTTGNMKEEKMSCSLFCSSVEQEIA